MRTVGGDTLPPTWEPIAQTSLLLPHANYMRIYTYIHISRCSRVDAFSTGHRQASRLYSCLLLFFGMMNTAGDAPLSPPFLNNALLPRTRMDRESAVVVFFSSPCMSACSCQRRFACMAAEVGRTGRW